MNKLGTSYISQADMYLFMGALVLVVGLYRVPRHTIWSRAAAVVILGVVFTIVIIMILSNNLNKNAVFELSGIAGVLCYCLWKWNEVNVSANAEPEDTLSNKALKN